MPRQMCSPTSTFTGTIRLKLIQNSKPVPMPKKTLPDLVGLFRRASAFYAYSNCAVSFRLAQAAGPEPDTADSTFGTATHALLAKKKKAEATPEATEMARDLEAQYQKSFASWTQSISAPPGPLYSERRLYLKQDHFTLASGQPDRFRRAGANAYLADFKSSWHPIDAFPATNAQLGVYAALIFDFFHQRLESLHAAILKPGNRLPPTIFAEGELVEVRHWTIDIAQRALAPPPGAQPRKGPWCRYCSGKILCPLWQNELKNLASFTLEDLDTLSDQALANLGPRLELVSQIITRLSQRLYESVSLRPSNFPGWSITPGAFRRKITSTTQAYQLLVRSNTIDHDSFLSASKVSITALRRLVPDKLLNSLLTPDGTLTLSQNPPHLSYDPSLQTCPSSPSLLPLLSQTQIPPTQPLHSLAPGQNETH